MYSLKMCFLLITSPDSNIMEYGVKSSQKIGTHRTNNNL